MKSPSKNNNNVVVEVDQRVSKYPDEYRREIKEQKRAPREDVSNFRKSVVSKQQRAQSRIERFTRSPLRFIPESATPEIKKDYIYTEQIAVQPPAVQPAQQPVAPSVLPKKERAKSTVRATRIEIREPPAPAIKSRVSRSLTRKDKPVKKFQIVEEFSHPPAPVLVQEVRPKTNLKSEQLEFARKEIQDKLARLKLESVRKENPPQQPNVVSVQPKAEDPKIKKDLQMKLLMLRIKSSAAQHKSTPRDVSSAKPPLPAVPVEAKQQVKQQVEQPVEPKSIIEADIVKKLINVKLETLSPVPAKEDQERKTIKDMEKQTKVKEDLLAKLKQKQEQMRPRHAQALSVLKVEKELQEIDERLLALKFKLDELLKESATVAQVIPDLAKSPNKRQEKQRAIEYVKPVNSVSITA